MEDIANPPDEPLAEVEGLQLNKIFELPLFFNGGDCVCSFTYFK